MAKQIIIENEAERLFVRSVYPTAHCREVPNQPVKTFGVFYLLNKKGTPVWIATSTKSRAQAWKNTAAELRIETILKLES